MATDNDTPWYPDDSGEWVEHDGSGMPVDSTALVVVLLSGERDAKDKSVTEDIPVSADSWSWVSNPAYPKIRIVAYRLV